VGWFLRLVRRRKDPARFPAAFAALAARAAASGRRLSGQERARDVLSPLAQRRHGFRVEPLPTSPRVPHEALHGSPRRQRNQDAFEERLQDNTQTPVPEQAAFRLDFRAWRVMLSPRQRRLVRAMIRGERTGELARRFKVTPARVSQLRAEFRRSWLHYCGEAAAAHRATPKEGDDAPRRGPLPE
jgi:hypothetical protein